MPILTRKTLILQHSEDLRRGTETETSSSTLSVTQKFLLIGQYCSQFLRTRIMYIHGSHLLCLHTSLGLFLVICFLAGPNCSSQVDRPSSNVEILRSDPELIRPLSHVIHQQRVMKRTPRYTSVISIETGVMQSTDDNRCESRLAGLFNTVWGSRIQAPFKYVPTMVNTFNLNHE
jgi:hypothetical protein